MPKEPLSGCRRHHGPFSELIFLDLSVVSDTAHHPVLLEAVSALRPSSMGKKMGFPPISQAVSWFSSLQALFASRLVNFVARLGTGHRLGPGPSRSCTPGGLDILRLWVLSAFGGSTFRCLPHYPSQLSTHVSKCARRVSTRHLSGISDHTCLKKAPASTLVTPF